MALRAGGPGRAGKRHRSEARSTRGADCGRPSADAAALASALSQLGIWALNDHNDRVDLAERLLEVGVDRDGLDVLRQHAEFPGRYDDPGGILWHWVQDPATAVDQLSDIREGEKQNRIAARARSDFGPVFGEAVP